MPKSKFEEIYRNLKNKVEQGDYLYGELLPSENTLIGMYDCSRNTIRRAGGGWLCPVYPRQGCTGHLSALSKEGFYHRRYRNLPGKCPEKQLLL